MIPAGSLRHRIVIERRVGTTNELGEETEAWGVLMRDVPAARTPVRDTERMQARQLGSAVTDRFLVRWHPRLATLDTEDRFWLKRPGLPLLLYEITGIKPTGADEREGIEITAAAQPNALASPGVAPWLPSVAGSPMSGGYVCDRTITIPWVIDGGGAPILPGVSGHLHLDFAAVVLGWTMLGDGVGSTIVDVWRVPFALFDPAAPRPDATDSITGGNYPRIIEATKAQSDGQNLVGWSIGLNRHDVLAFNVVSSTHQRVTLGLRLQKV